MADYVIVMGYDEHYAGGEAGSVSSIPYVREGIENTLKEVPKEKVINAVPFYTRVWTVNEGERRPPRHMAYQMPGSGGGKPGGAYLG